MSRRSMTVRQLAAQTRLDLDETLVTLWDAGFDEIDDIDDRVPKNQVANALRVLGLETPRERRTIAYWANRTSLGPDQLRAWLAQRGVVVSPSARVLPKGALARLDKNDRLDPQHPIPQSRPTGGVDDNPVEPEPKFQWHIVGSNTECHYLDADEVDHIHWILVREFLNTTDPISPAGIRDQGLFESAIHRPRTSMAGQYKYPTAEMASGALLHSLVHNHPLHNGNKRTALVAMLVSLDRNGKVLTCGQDELFRYVLRTAQHRLVPPHWSSRSDREVLAISEWIYSNTRTITKGERPITWRELRKILTRFGCSIGDPVPGNKIKIRRKIKRRTIIGHSRVRTSTVTAWYGGEGRELSLDHLHDLRKRLSLDNDSGCDSTQFYGKDGRQPDEFIAEYRTILKRLARL